jgi:8-oxo-dGTP diphosphatase
MRGSMKAAKLVSTRRNGREVLLVRRRRDRRWMFPGGKRKRRLNESMQRCLEREISEELPELRLADFRLWRKLKGVNPYSGRKMSDAIFVTDAKGPLTIGAPREIDRVAWRRPWRLDLTPTSRTICDILVDEGYLEPE